MTSSNRREPLGAGPFPLDVTPYAGGLDIDVSAVLASFVHALADEFANDPEAVAEKLTELSEAGRLATAPGTDRERKAAADERDEIAEGFVARCSDEGRLRVQTGQAGRLVERMCRLLGIRPLPRQRGGEEQGERGAAA
ncbi:hypothetical protein [Streptomyces sp. NBC_01207]|uniref:hypothetical protein n=1 Tax=Streptomyces sp. NBC_01207 TaxID=2903772 RepID=UPI002E14980D|nr:hypothetical protein OG457_27100 [Streptomyces sp. NBC_01207]